MDLPLRSSFVRRALAGRAARGFASGALAVWLACGALACGAPSPAEAPANAEALAEAEAVPAPTEPVHFAYDSLDGRPVSSAAFLGRIAVITFFTTGNLESQAQVNVLSLMQKHDGDRVAYAAIAMEPRSNRELIEIYRSQLALPFPVALADEGTLLGRSELGGIEAVPTTVVLDEFGRVQLKKLGVVKPDELRAVMRPHARKKR